MQKIIISLYLIGWFVGLTITLLYQNFLDEFDIDKHIFQCTILGSIGSIVYCMRGFYLNYCILKR
jgi:hypothetical protein